MSEFFNKETLEIIKKNESKPKKIKNFVTKEFCNELMDYRKSISKKMVDREESTKVPFEFETNSLTKELKNEMQKLVGDFSVKDFEPHFITTRYPLRLHADTGKDPNDAIFKNIVVPLEVNYKEEKYKKNYSHTVIFKNKWYDRSALFTTKTSKNYDFIIKDQKGEFIDIIDIHDFKEKIKKYSNEVIEYHNAKFFVDPFFKNYIDTLSKTKRYNQRTARHIKSDNNFNIGEYDKYMSHQPYEDCKGLEIDEALSWEPGSLLTWDRVRIHASDNFLKNGISSKTCIALFTSK